MNRAFSASDLSSFRPGALPQARNENASLTLTKFLVILTCGVAPGSKLERVFDASEERDLPERANVVGNPCPVRAEGA